MPRVRVAVDRVLAALPATASVLCPSPGAHVVIFRRTSRRLLPASLPIAVALRPRFPDVTTVCRLLGGTAAFTLSKGVLMVSRYFGWAGAFALAGLLPYEAHAATDADLAEIRAQIQQLKESYEARIQALEERLKEAETGPPARGRPNPRRRPSPAVAAASPAAPPPPASAAASAALQSGDLGGAARRVRQSVAGSEQLRDRRIRAERRHRARPSEGSASPSPS